MISDDLKQLEAMIDDDSVSQSQYNLALARCIQDLIDAAKERDELHSKLEEATTKVSELLERINELHDIQQAQDLIIVNLREAFLKAYYGQIYNGSRLFGITYTEEEIKAKAEAELLKVMK